MSFGGVASSISLPCRMSHASVPAAVRKARCLPEDLVRISVGIEDAVDLVEDLTRAIARATMSAANVAVGEVQVPGRVVDPALP